MPAPKSLRATRIFDNDRQPRGLLYCPIRTAVKETSALSSALPARCNTNSLMSGGAHRVLRCRNARCRAAIPDSPYGTRGPWPHGSQSPTPGVDKRDSREKKIGPNNSASVLAHFGLAITARALCPSASWVLDFRISVPQFAAAETSRLNGALRKLGAHMF